MIDDPEFYLDNAATTALLPEALQAGMPFLQGTYGNPSSLHRMGMDASRAIKNARRQLSRLLMVPPEGITFTSGATEANNLALSGVFDSSRPGGELLISAIEHPAVAETAKALASKGIMVRWIPINQEGQADLAALAKMLTAKVRMVSCMAVSNELGTAQPMEAIGRLIAERAPQAIFHVDGVQGFTKGLPALRSLGAHLVSLSAHKVHGPKGIGALVRCKPVHLAPITWGGGQEAGLRSGTENPFAIVAFAEAARRSTQLHAAQLEERRAYHGAWLEFLGQFDRLRVFRSPQAVPYIISFAIPPLPGEVILHHLEAEGLMVSTGSACSTHKPEPSPALLAAGLGTSYALSAIRLSFSHHNTLAGLDFVFPAFRRAMLALEKI